MASLKQQTAQCNTQTRAGGSTAWTQHGKVDRGGPHHSMDSTVAAHDRGPHLQCKACIENIHNGVSSHMQARLQFMGATLPLKPQCRSPPLLNHLPISFYAILLNQQLYETTVTGR